MASYVLIEVDRTKPAIEIYAPRYTTSEIVNEISVKANEPLSSYQEFYAVDHQGNRQDYTFFLDDQDTYIGRIRFNTLSLGLINFYARVRDEVDNISDVAVATIDVKEHIPLLKLNIKQSIRPVIVDDSPHSSLKTNVRQAEVQIDETLPAIASTERTRKIDTKNRKAD